MLRDEVVMRGGYRAAWRQEILSCYSQKQSFVPITAATVVKLQMSSPSPRLPFLQYAYCS